MQNDNNNKTNNHSSSFSGSIAIIVICYYFFTFGGSNSNTASGKSSGDFNRGTIEDYSGSQGAKLLASLNFEIGGTSFSDEAFGNSTETIRFGEYQIGESQKSSGAIEQIGNGLDQRQATRPIHSGSPEQQQYIDYAWNISHDATFIYLLKAENGAISPTTKHKTPHYSCNLNGNVAQPSHCTKNEKNYIWEKHYDWGFCGTSDDYQQATQSDARFLTDWKWQLDQCYSMYSRGVTFYGRNNIWKVKKFFTWE